MWQVKVDPTALMFMDNQETATREKIRHAINLLEEYGHLLRPPHSKKMTGYGNFYELRTSGTSPVRLFYTIHNNIFYIIHGFIKKTNKTPKKEINLAIKRIDNLTNI